MGDCPGLKEDTMTEEIDRWMVHVRALAEGIGPRGSTTEGERQASVYCHQVLSALGLEEELVRPCDSRMVVGCSSTSSAEGAISAPSDLPGSPVSRPDW